MQVIEYLRDFNIVSVLLRLFLAMLMGGFIGLEREFKHRPAGFRTYMLVCIGAALAMMLGQYESDFLATISTGRTTDVSRYGAQVINGIGFLGAGTILVSGHREIKGLTTAAGLWASACMGLSIGAGFYECALFALIIIFLCIKVFPKLEHSVLSKSRVVNIYVEMQNLADIEQITAVLRKDNITIKSIDFYSQEENEAKHPGAVLSLLLSQREHHEFISATLLQLPIVYSVEEI